MNLKRHPELPKIMIKKRDAEAPLPDAEQMAKWRQQRIWRLAKWHYSFPFAEDLPGLTREKFEKTIHFSKKK